ncbi:MAG: hypothetical protein V3R99_03630 [Thermoguttaceae bacterium]
MNQCVRWASEPVDRNLFAQAKTKLTLGPMLKMHPKSETFADNDAANAMLTREYRAPFVVPAAGEV